MQDEETAETSVQTAGEESDLDILLTEPLSMERRRYLTVFQKQRIFVLRD